MPATNDPNQGGSGALAELFRLQTEFAARLADETLRYLRRLQGAIAPAAPGTIVLQEPDVLIAAAGMPGGSVDVVIEVENLQRVHCLVRPQLTPLVASSGATWFPEADPVSRLVAPGETAEIRVHVLLPSAIPAGDYRGAVLLEGFRERGIPVVVSVEATAADGGPGAAVATAAAANGEAAPAATTKAAAAAADPGPSPGPAAPGRRAATRRSRRAPSTP